MDLHHLAKKCSYMYKYLDVKHIRPSDFDKKVFMIFSNLKPFVHKIRMNRIKKFIPHTHKLN